MMHSACARCQSRLRSRGFSLIELIIGLAVVLIAFVAIMAAFQAGLDLLSLNKSRGIALTLASERIEYARSLSYDAVGTIAGIPSGAIPQLENVSLNGRTYVRRTFIQYVDDAADGLGVADATGVTADYKRIKVEVSWQQGGATSSVALVSNVVPRGIESLTGGGTLRVTVINAYGAPLQGAEVRIRNSTGTSSIDVTAYTDIAGSVIFPGTPQGSGYQITATKFGYSTDQTYGADAANPNPSPAHVSVIDGVSTSVTLAIDELSSKRIRTREPIVEGVFTDTFSDASGLSVLATTSVSGGALMLSDSAGTYATAGFAESDNITPPFLSSWGVFVASDLRPAGTTITYTILYDTGAGFAPVPDTDLPGNGSGFSSTPVSLSTLSPTTYPSLRIRASFETTDTATTSHVLSWSLNYIESYVPIGSIPFTMRGAKTIGLDGGGNPIYKFNQSLMTDAGGEIIVNNLEWDSYTIMVDAGSGYDVAEFCLPQPRGIIPNSSVTTEIGLVPAAPHTLRVIVRNTNNDLVQGALVRLTRSGVDDTETTGSCGQVFFTPLATASDYTIEVSSAGYTTTTQNNITVNNDTVVDIILSP